LGGKTGAEMEIDKQKIESAIKMILEATGADCSSEDFKDTPERVARMYEEITCGYNEDAGAILQKTFEADGSGTVIEKDIYFSSTCEHHLMPFFGRVHIAYVPNGRVAGISKLARVVDCFAKRFQLQERMTAQIADALFENLNPIGVMVVSEAEHTCMTARGVKKIGSKTLCSAVRGNFDADAQARVLALTGGRQ
jgi:GTP cyclohydrolase I